MNKLRFGIALGLLCVLYLVPFAHAQYEIKGTVVDARTEEPLVGVHILVGSSTLGTTTDPSGRFELRSTLPILSLMVSYVGYKAQTVRIDEPQLSLSVRLEPAPIDLQPVVVSASREVQSRTEAPLAITALSSRHLDETKPSMLYQALNQVPGVYMVNLGNEQYKMSIRQPFTNKAFFLYLEDGLPLRPTGNFNPNALIEVNMGGVDRIEVIRGPVSSLYGSNAVAGAINFITPAPTRLPSGAFSVRSDNYGYRRGDFSLSSSFGRLGVYAGGYVARQRDAWFEHSDFDKVSLTFRADYHLAPATRLVTSVSTNHLNTDTNGALDSLNFFGRGITSLHTFTYRKVDATRIRSTLSHAWNAQNRTQVTAYYRNNAVKQLPYYRVRNNRKDRTKATGQINENAFWSVGALAQHEVFFDILDARLISGVSFDRSPMSYYARYIDVERDADGRYVGYTDPDSLLTDYDVDLVNTAAYARFELHPTPRLKLITSLRFDRIDYDYDNHLSPSAYSGAPDERNGFNRLSPKVGFTYDVGRGRGFYASYSRGFVPPEIGELYHGVKVPILKPATFTSYEVGGWSALLQGTLYLDASLYYMDGTNEIISVVLDDGSRQNRNAGHTRHYGIEYAVLYTPVNSLTLRLSGTNARHTFVEYKENGSDYDGHAMNGAPNWIANAEVSYRPSFLKGARVALEWQHLGGYYMDEANTKHYDGYDVLHARVGYTFGGVEVWANLDNLTDALYATTAAAYTWGTIYNPGQVRTLSVGLGYRFK
ncbi:MAG: TonB-dependent receptor [Rhodothermales bacterium]